MSFKKGDIIIKEPTFVGSGKRVYRVEQVRKYSSLVKCIFLNGTIRDDMPVKCWDHKGFKYAACYLATAKKLETLVFPEGMKVFHANVDAGNIVPTPAVWSMVSELDKLKKILGIPESYGQWDELAITEGIKRQSPEHVVTIQLDKCRDKHEPMEYTGFNSAMQIICRKCNKNL
jgi:hypothetical protein